MRKTPANRAKLLGIEKTVVAIMRKTAANMNKTIA